jgi:geranylgeranylglycerol-phosphate geranylgeranyltransferase
MNGLMTYFTYFKDYEGDLKAGKKTLIVRWGADKAKRLGVFFSFLPAALFGAFYFLGYWPDGLSPTFWLLAALTLFLELWTARLYYKNPAGERAYYSLAANFRACVCGQTALIALYDDRLAPLLFLVTYIFVGFLFDLHHDARS